MRRQTHQNNQAFDENSIEISVSHGNSQLSEIKLSCQWINTAIMERPPTLQVIWFNKTETSLQKIDALTDQESYQPCLSDVGSIIYIQIMPVCKNRQYLGMPIIKQIGPLTMSSETEEQASDILQSEKATFFIELRQLSLSEHMENYSEEDGDDNKIRQCLIKFNKNRLFLYGRKPNEEKLSLFLEEQITSQFPQIIFNRSACKELNIIFNNKNQYAIFTLHDHKIRDVFYLLVKLIVNQYSQSSPIPNQQILKQQPIQINSFTEHPDKIPQISNQKTATSLFQLTPKLSQSKRDANTPIKNTPLINSRKKSQNLTDILLISELKDKISKLQFENSKIFKECENFKKDNKILADKYNVTKQQFDTLTVKSNQHFRQNIALEQSNKKFSQELSYHKNQSKILHQELMEIKVILEDMVEKKVKLEEQLKNMTTKNHNKQIELENEVINLKQINAQLAQKIKYQLEMNQEINQELKKCKRQLEELHFEKKMLEKKINGVMNEINREKHLEIKHEDPIHSEERRKSEEISKNNQQKQELKEKEHQSFNKELSHTKKEIIDLIEENLYLRSKEKSSKNDLKLELVQFKKLVKKLYELLHEKDIEIQQIKFVNKSICLQLLEHNNLIKNSSN